MEQFWGETLVACPLKLTAIGRLISAQHTRCTAVARRVETSEKNSSELFHVGIVSTYACEDTFFAPRRRAVRQTASSSTMAESDPHPCGQGTATTVWTPSTRRREWSTDLLGRALRKGREEIGRFGWGGSPRP